MREPNELDRMVVGGDGRAYGALKGRKNVPGIVANNCANYF